MSTSGLNFAYKMDVTICFNDGVHRMPKNQDTMVTAFGGTFFEVMIWRCSFPCCYRAFVLVRQRAEGAEVFKHSIDVDLAQLRELSHLTKTAVAMIDFLNQGGHVENWHVEPAAVPAED